MNIAIRHTVNIRKELLGIVLLTWLLIDSISGFLLFENMSLAGISLGAAYRIVVFLLLFTYLKRYTFHAVFLFTFFLSFSFLHSFISLGELFDQRDLLFFSQKTIKVIFPVIIFFVIREALKSNTLSYKMIKKVIFFNSAILLLNIFLFLAGVGTSTYGMSDDEVMMGGKGFLFAGNEVNGALLSLYTLIVLINFNKSPLRLLIISIIFLTASMILLSKSSIFGFLVLAFALFLIKNSRKFLMFTPFLVILGVALYYLMQNIINMALSRWIFFIDKYGALIYFLGGEKRLNAISNFFNNLTERPIILLIGEGWTGLCENNFCDLIQAFGIWGIIILSFWIYFIYKYSVIYKKSKSKQSLLVVFFFILIILQAYFAGHILQSALMAPFLALLANFDLINEKM